MLFDKKLAMAVTLLLSMSFVAACTDDSSSETPQDTESTMPMDGSATSGNSDDADATSTTPAENQGESNDPPADDASVLLESQLQSVVDAAVQNGLPGVSLHVQQGEESVSVVAGVVNRETAEPVTPASPFSIASVGKTYVATMIMRFVDMGMLQLDDPIERWLDPVISAMVADAGTISVQMLLSHTSGIPDYLTEDYLVDYVEAPGKLWTPTEALGYIKELDNLFQPGEEFSYSNSNFVILGAIAEHVTGGSLSAALRQWVLEPGGLEHTYHPQENIGQPEVAHGYVPASAFEGAPANLNLDLPADGSDLDVFDWVVSDGLGDAPVISTPSDMNLFIRTLIDTDSLLPGELKTQMLTESFPGSDYGLGIVVTDDSLVYGHSGQFFGYYARLIYAPTLDTSYATTVNASEGDYGEFFEEYLTQLGSVLERQLAQRPSGLHVVR